jgi:hypothetical protein
MKEARRWRADGHREVKFAIFKKRAKVFRKRLLKVFASKPCCRERNLENVYRAGDLLTKLDTYLLCVLVPWRKIAAKRVKQQYAFWLGGIRRETYSRKNSENAYPKSGCQPIATVYKQRSYARSRH